MPFYYEAKSNSNYNLRPFPEIHAHNRKLRWNIVSDVLKVRGYDRFIRSASKDDENNDKCKDNDKDNTELVTAGGGWINRG